MNLDAVAKLVGMEHGLAVVSTARADGTIQSSVVNAGVMKHPVTGVPSVAFVAAGSSKRLQNLRARPHATVVVRAGWQWAGVEGAVQLSVPMIPSMALTCARFCATSSPRRGAHTTTGTNTTASWRTNGASPCS
jgi:hypothetical protein